MDNNANNNNLFVDDSLNNFGTQPNPNTVNNTEALQPNTNVVNSDETLQANTNTINNEIQQASTEKTIFDNDVTEPQLTPIEPQTNDTKEKTTVTEPSPSVDKQKKSKGPVVAIILLILLVLGLGGYIVYDKFIASEDGKEQSEKNANNQNVVEDTTIEFWSPNSLEYLKLDTETKTFELKLDTSVSYDKTGQYTENGTEYILGDNIRGAVKVDYIELSGIKNEGYEYYNYILFKKDKLEDVKSKITSSIKSYIENISSNETSAPEIENVNVSIGKCFKYAMSGADLSEKTSENVSCGTGYEIHFKDYNKDECDTKYINYIVSAGSCEDDHVSNGFYALFDELDNYKILSTYTGM